MLILAVVAEAAPTHEAAFEGRRFFHSGDGRIHLVHDEIGASFDGTYRRAEGSYDRTALEAICRVFDAPFDPDLPHLSLRLIEYLDFLEDRLAPGTRITIVSGYRSPSYNTRLRTQGGLAAKASLHQYGMAADLRMDGVPSHKVWLAVKTLGFGGAGYYHGDMVHVDVGPARSWDEKTSGVGMGLSDDNKLIGLVTDLDVYRPGERMVLRYIRMTAFPIEVNTEFALERQEREGRAGQTALFSPKFAIPATGTCTRFKSIAQMSSMHWNLPDNLPPGRYKVRARFCDNPWSEMPRDVTTADFKVAGP